MQMQKTTDFSIVFWLPTLPYWIIFLWLGKSNIFILWWRWWESNPRAYEGLE